MTLTVLGGPANQLEPMLVSPREKAIGRSIKISWLPRFNIVQWSLTVYIANEEGDMIEENFFIDTMLDKDITEYQLPKLPRGTKYITIKLSVKYVWADRYYHSVNIIEVDTTPWWERVFERIWS